MRYLVTGGAGFIGSNLAIELEKQGNEVIVADNFSFGKKDNLLDFKGKVVDVDLSHPFLFDEKFDAIFHQAAITDPRYEDEDETIRQNLEGFRFILKLARKDNAKLVYASTGSLYGNGPAPQKEDQPKELLSAYARSKIIMDEMASHNWNDMHIVGLRYFNVFGPNEAGKGRPASMVYHLAMQMLDSKRPRIFKMGEHKRDQIYVKDCVLANIKALDAPCGVYNVGTGEATTFNQLVEYINEGLGTDYEPDYFEMPYEPKTYQDHTQADTTRAEKMLGFKAQYSTREGVIEYVKMLKEEKVNQ